MRRECILNCTHDCRFINKSIKPFFPNSRKLVIKDLNIRIKIISLFWRRFVSQKYSEASERSGLYFQYHDHSCKLDLHDHVQTCDHLGGISTILSDAYYLGMPWTLKTVKIRSNKFQYQFLNIVTDAELLHSIISGGKKKF